MPGFTGFSGLPEVRAPGDWPGKEDSDLFVDFFGVITLLALLSALVLISNTMTTLVSEQTGEIGIMRAVGARRRQVALVYLKTALLLGAIGTLVGIALGILLSNLLASFFGSTFFAIDVGFGVDLTVVAVAALIGVLGPALAALPAIRRGTRVDLREALESTGSAVGSQDAGDRLLRRVRFLPRTMQIGLRGVGRRKRRTLATALVVALAVGNLLAIMGLAAAATKATRAAWGEHIEEIRIWTGGGTPFDERAAQVNPLDPRSRRGAAGTRQRRRALRRRGIRLGRAARAAHPPRHDRRALVHGRRGAGTRPGRRDRAQSGRAHRHGGRRPRDALDRGRRRLASGSSGSRTTARRTAPSCSSRSRHFARCCTSPRG